MPFGLSYYLFPIISGIVWAGTLLALLIRWVANGKQVYPSMSDGQTIAYISDEGAQLLKPLFIAGSAVTIVSFDLVFITEQWLRHRGRLAPATSKSEKVLAALASLTSIIGGAGLILLSIFDTLRFPKVHQAMLAVFIVGYLLTAIFVCAEYQRLGIHQREHRILRISFWIKLTWVFVFIGLALGFGLSQRRKMYNTAAILEWVIGFLFAFFVATFAIDLLPAIRTRSKSHRFPTIRQMEKGNVPRQNHDYSSEGSLGGGQPATQAGGRYYDAGATSHIPSRKM